MLYACLSFRTHALLALSMSSCVKCERECVLRIKYNTIQKQIAQFYGPTVKNSTRSSSGDVSERPIIMVIISL